MQTLFPIARQIKRTLAQDPRRTSLACGLVAVTCLLWLRMWSSGPASATASFTGGPLTVVNNAVAAEVIPPSRNTVRDWLSKPQRELDRNLFVLHLDRYPTADERQANSKEPEDPAKSQPNEADQNKDWQMQGKNRQAQKARQEIVNLMTATPTPQREPAP